MSDYNYRDQLHPVLNRPAEATHVIDLACKTCLALATRVGTEPQLVAHVEQEHTK